MDMNEESNDEKKNEVCPSSNGKSTFFDTHELSSYRQCAQQYDPNSNTNQTNCKDTLKPSTPKNDIAFNDEEADDLVECPNGSTIISSSPYQAVSLQCSTEDTSQYEDVASCHEHYDNTRNDNKRRKIDDIHILCTEATRLKDIIGHARAKLRIEEIILPLGLPYEVTTSVLRGIRSMPASILLYGPPGCGKVSSSSNRLSLGSISPFLGISYSMPKRFSFCTYS
jgi:hypothetical protein